MMSLSTKKYHFLMMLSYIFTDDITIHKDISSPDDVKLLQLDLSSVAQWAKK